MGRFTHLETDDRPPAAAAPTPAAPAAHPTPAAPSPSPDDGLSFPSFPRPREASASDAPTTPAPDSAFRRGIAPRIITPAGTPASPPSAPATESRDDDEGDTTESTLGDADWAYYTGDFEKALRLYSRVIQLDAMRISPWVGQVYSLLRRGQGSEALTWANRALEMFPEHPTLLSARAVAYATNGMVKRAIGASDYALSRGTTREAWLARGEVLLAAGRTNALACFDKALEATAQDDWKTLMHVGMVLASYRKQSAAIEYLQRAVQLRTDNAHLWFLIGECAIRLGWRERAMQSYERAHQLAPTNQHYRRAWDRAKAVGPIGRLLMRLRGA